MKVKIIGKEVVPYVDRETGEQKVSKKIHVEEISSAPVSGLEGSRTHTITANSSDVNFSGIKVGATYLISTDTSNFGGKKSIKLAYCDEVKA